MTTLLLASVLFAGLFVSLGAAPAPAPGPGPGPGPGPYHAFCKALWLFKTPCTEISFKLGQQIVAFSPEYELVSFTIVAIKANHTSLESPEGENITFKLSPTVLTPGCLVSAQSISLGFTSLLDGGLNYCNTYNLLAASGLTSQPDVMEMTNEWACLGYGLATCRT